MRVINKEIKFCLSCMESHEVQRVETRERNMFKDVEFEYIEISDYCEKTDELIQDEDMIRLNTIAFKDAYKKKIGLLSSEEIVSIRNMYGFSQSDLSKILGWGEKTITRYESFQVQDSAHNDLLIRVGEDPKWLLGKLDESREVLSGKAYKKYKTAAVEAFREKGNSYIIDAIESEYISVGEEASGYGCKPDIKKVVAVINYIAGKIDYLRGLKENVIIGKLIPAGTGYADLSENELPATTEGGVSAEALLEAELAGDDDLDLSGLGLISDGLEEEVSEHLFEFGNLLNDSEPGDDVDSDDDTDPGDSD